LTLAYLVGYGWLLAGSGFVPYVFDNNETYSTFVHARNLLSFPLTQSFGLADEALGPSTAAHPFIYTHGGNLPRLFGVFLDVIGLQTPEAQIAVTTFSVGLISLFLTYLYFRQVSGALFALIACLVLMSDYVLFAQWQVNTWRVWHALFLFAALLCAHYIASHRGSSRFLTILVGLGVAYFELIFGAFVVIFAAAYAAILYRRRLRVWLEYVALLATGALLSFVVLNAQRVAYLGWTDALTDTYLTYFARLGQNDAPSGLEPLRSFYDSHHIAFWYNVVDPRAFGSIGAFAQGLFHYSFEVQTPLFSSIVLVLLAGWAAAHIPRGSSSSRLPQRARFAVVGKTLLLLGSCWLLLVVVFSGDLVLGLPPDQPWRFLIWDGRAVSLLASTVGSVVMTAVVDRLAGGGWLPRDQLRWRSVVNTAILLFGVAVFIRLQYRLYSESFLPLWLVVGSGWLSTGACRIAFAASCAVAACISLRGRDFGFPAHISGVVSYLCCGLVAYAVIYAVAAGYVMTGYVTRYAPLLVFLVDIAIALGLYIALTFTLNMLRARPGASAIAGAVSLFMVGYWIHMQAAYVGQLPPSLYTFLSTLAQPPYRGASFVATNYAAPFASFTQQWAYYDPVLGDGVSTAGYVLARDTRSYLWQADKESNPAYFKPDYFLCFIPDTLSSVIQRLNSVDGSEGRCSGSGLVNAARTKSDYPHRLVARDQSGHDAWAIIKLDPAYELLPGEQATPPPQGDIALGSNWYPHEVFAGESFHWVRNDAEVIVTGPTNGPGVLRLDLQAGPGLAGQEFTLQVVDNRGQPAASVPVVGRQSVRVKLPVSPGASATYRLHVDGGGRPTPGDQRTLNFRVFSIDWDSG
jgi:hypothetical protein